MPGTTINPAMTFQPYGAPPYGVESQTFSDFSPNSLFDSYEDFATDFNSDSTGSPISPISPVLSSSSFGLADDWMTWDTIDQTSPVNSFIKPEPVDASILTSIPQRTVSLSPAVNPMDLSLPPTSMSFLPEDMAKPLPMFQQAAPATLPTPVLYSAAQTTTQADDAQAAPLSSQRRSSRGIKRKSSCSGSDDEEASPPPAPARRNSPPTTQQQQKKEKEDLQGPKKTAHNMIEKRYRTNLNDKIAQLRDSVPALRIVAQRLDQQQSGEDGAELHDGEADLTPAPKLNKATILSKATEYIAQLERRNRGLESENNMLRGRMEGLEMLMMNRGAGNLWN